MQDSESNGKDPDGIWDALPPEERQAFLERVFQIPLHARVEWARENFGFILARSGRAEGLTELFLREYGAGRT